MRKEKPVSGGTCIGVIGAATVDESTHRLAREVGQGLGRAGAVLVCGGLGGVMQAASQGAREAGGVVMGILPGNDRRAGNEFLSLAVVTGMGEARNVLVVRSSQAVIAIGGAYGTLSEIAFCLKIGVPVIGLSTWRLEHDGGLPEPDPIRRVATAEQAVQKALELAEGGL